MIAQTFPMKAGLNPPVPLDVLHREPFTDRRRILKKNDGVFRFALTDASTLQYAVVGFHFNARVGRLTG